MNVASELAAVELPDDISITVCFSEISRIMERVLPSKDDLHPFLPAITRPEHFTETRTQESDNSLSISIIAWRSSQKNAQNDNGELAAKIIIIADSYVKISFNQFLSYARKWLKRIVIDVKNMWPATRVTNGQWIFDEISAKWAHLNDELIESDFDDYEENEDVSNDWSKEPITKNKLDWFKHRHWCDENEHPKRTHDEMGAICHMKGQSFKNAYHAWKKKIGFDSTVRNSTKNSTK